MRSCPAIVALTVACALGMLAWSCQDDGHRSQSLQVEVVAVSFVRQTDGQVVSQLRPLPQAQVTATWNNKLATLETPADGIVQFADFFPTLTRPVDVFVRSSATALTAVAVLGWSQAQLQLPFTVSDNVTDAAATALTLGVVEFQVTGWTASQLGQRSEAQFAYAHRDGLKPVSSAIAAMDTYVRSGFADNTQAAVCQCIDATVLACLQTQQPDCDACPSDKIVCSNQSVFAGGLSGATLFLPAGVNQVGFVERIVDYERQQMLNVGKLFLERQLVVEAELTAQHRVRPYIFAAPEQCSNTNGKLRLTLLGLPRSFVQPEQGGLWLTVDLVSYSGLRLPIIWNELWRREQVIAEGHTQQAVELFYPFALTDQLADFYYDYSVVATRAVAGIAEYVSQSGQWRYNGSCQLYLNLQPRPADFVGFTTTSPVLLQQPLSLVWSGSIEPLRRLQFMSSEATGYSLTLWLTRSEQLSLDLSGPVFADYHLPAGAYDFDYTVIQAAAPINLVLPGVLRPQARPFAYQQRQRVQIVSSD